MTVSWADHLGVQGLGLLARLTHAPVASYTLTDADLTHLQLCLKQMDQFCPCDPSLSSRLFLLARQKYKRMGKNTQNSMGLGTELKNNILLCSTAKGSHKFNPYAKGGDIDTTF